MNNDIPDTFLSNIDIINDYCKEQKDSCGKCILNDYCLDIPARSYLENGMRAANKAVELIRIAKEGEGYKKVTIRDVQIDGE